MLTCCLFKVQLVLVRLVLFCKELPFFCTVTVATWLQAMSSCLVQTNCLTTTSRTFCLKWVNKTWFKWPTGNLWLGVCQGWTLRTCSSNSKIQLPIPTSANSRIQLTSLTCLPVMQNALISAAWSLKTSTSATRRSHTLIKTRSKKSTTHSMKIIIWLTVSMLRVKNWSRYLTARLRLKLRRLG